MLDRIRDWIRSPLRVLPGLDILCDYPPEVIEKQKLKRQEMVNNTQPELFPPSHFAQL